MTYRLQSVIIFFAYLFLNSVLFAAVFTQKYIGTGLAAGFLAQLLALYLILLVKRTEP